MTAPKANGGADPSASSTGSAVNRASKPPSLSQIVKKNSHHGSFKVAKDADECKTDDGRAAAQEHPNDIPFEVALVFKKNRTAKQNSEFKVTKEAIKKWKKKTSEKHKENGTFLSRIKAFLGMSQEPKVDMKRAASDQFIAAGKAHAIKKKKLEEKLKVLESFDEELQQQIFARKYVAQVLRDKGLEVVEVFDDAASLFEQTALVLIHAPDKLIVKDLGTIEGLEPTEESNVEADEVAITEAKSLERASKGLPSGAKIELIEKILGFMKVDPDHLKDDSEIKCKPPRGMVAGDLILSRCFDLKLVQQIVRVHANRDIENLRRSWILYKPKIQSPADLVVLPVEKVKAYFGAQIALYFSFLRLYTISLVLPGTIGCALFIHQNANGLDSPETMCFCMLLAIWSTVFLEMWKRQSSTHAFKWNNMGFEDRQMDRPEYFGDTRVIDDITGKEVIRYNMRKKWFRRAGSWLVVLLLVVFASVANWYALVVGDYINGRVAEFNTAIATVANITNVSASENYHICKQKAILVGLLEPSTHLPDIEWEAWPFVGMYPTVVLAILISALSMLFTYLATELTDFENHLKQTDYDDALTLKLVLLQFVNHFLYLYYTAFWLQDLEMLRGQLATLLIVKQLVGQTQEVGIPWLLQKYNDYQAKKREDEFDKVYKSRGRRRSTKGAIFAAMAKHKEKELTGGIVKAGIVIDKYGAEQKLSDFASEINSHEIHHQAAMPVYPSPFDDYLELFVQFGHVTLFAAVFPLASLCAFANNIVEIRSDGYKLLTSFQRPELKKCEDIGTWLPVFEFMSYMAVTTNCALLGMTSGHLEKFMPGSTPMHKIIFVVALEHVLLLIKIALAYVIPDVPHWIRINIARAQAKKRAEEDRQRIKEVEIASGISKGSPSVHASPRLGAVEPTDSGSDMSELDDDFSEELDTVSSRSAKRSPKRKSNRRASVSEQLLGDGSMIDGLAKGGKSVITGALSGVLGVVSAPLKGAAEDGVAGFTKGLATGVTGLVVKPMQGVANAASSVSKGFKQTAGAGLSLARGRHRSEAHEFEADIQAARYLEKIEAQLKETKVKLIEEKTKCFELENKLADLEFNLKEGNDTGSNANQDMEAVDLHRNTFLWSFLGICAIIEVLIRTFFKN